MVTDEPIPIRLEMEGRVATLTLNRPERGNALTPQMMKDIALCCGQAQSDGASVLVITGAGSKAFCSGYDLEQLADSFADDADAGGHALQEALAAVEDFAGATVALINGPAIGGGVLLALACDIRWASTDAFFQIPVSRLGLVYPLRGLQALVGAVGTTRAFQLLHCGDKVDAPTALTWNLLNGVGEGADWDREARAQIARIASHAPLSLAGHHRLVRMIRDGRLDTSEAERVAMEAIGSQDAQEGIKAILEKRLPQFRGM